MFVSHIYLDYETTLKQLLSHILHMELPSYTDMIYPLLYFLPSRPPYLLLFLTDLSYAPFALYC